MPEISTLSGNVVLGNENREVLECSSGIASSYTIRPRLIDRKGQREVASLRITSCVTFAAREEGRFGVCEDEVRVVLNSFNLKTNPGSS